MSKVNFGRPQGLITTVVKKDLVSVKFNMTFIYSIVITDVWGCNLFPRQNGSDLLWEDKGA